MGKSLKKRLVPTVCISSARSSQFLDFLCTLHCKNCLHTTFLILNYCIQKFHRSSNLLDTEMRRSLGHAFSSHCSTGEIVEQISLLQPFPALLQGLLPTSAGETCPCCRQTVLLLPLLPPSGAQGGRLTAWGRAVWLLLG